MSTSSGKPDSSYWQMIWDRFRAGNRQAFETLYNEFIDSLYAYGAKITSDKSLIEDAIQDLFMDAYTYGKGLRQPEYLEFYLFKTLKRIIIRKLKESNRLKAAGEITDRFDLYFPVEESDLYEQELEEKIKILKKEVINLDSKKRELLFLKFNSGLSYIEIGKLLDLNPDTVKKQVYRLLASLREKISRSFMELFIFCFKG